MNEFAKIIFEQWRKENDLDIEYFSNAGKDLLDEAEKYLNLDFVNKIYDMLCDNGEEIMCKAFIDGFMYACKCLSNGKIELSTK